MKQFRNILLVAPLNKQIVNQAVALLTTSQAKVTLMSIAPKLEKAEVVTGSGREINLQSLLEEELRADLDKSLEPLRKDGKRVRSIVTSGNHSFMEVIRQVVAKKHDLVMMLADGVTSVREQLFGTLSMHLMRKCPCAVWVVKPTRRRKPRKVFAAVDPDPENPARDELNNEILRRASGIAAHNNGELRVMHAWSAFGDHVNRSRRWMKKSEIRLYIERVADAHRKRLSRLLDKQTGETPQVHMMQGSPGTVIPESIEKHNGDLLVMGTVCRTGIPGFFIGNTAETILNQVNCSVLTVKPKSFVSPVL